VRRHPSSAALVLAALLAAGTAQAGTSVIDTTPSWDGSSTVYPWGHFSATQTCGQTVSAPAYASSLAGFSFILQDVNDFQGLGVPGPITYQAFVYRWDAAGRHITGAALWQSPVLQTPGTNTGNFVTTSFTTPGTAVAPGTEYMLSLTTNGIAVPTDGNTDWAFPYADAYSGSAFHFLNDPNFADLGTTAWSDSAAFGTDPAADLIFTAAFAVPEPGSLLVVGSALAGVGLLRRRSRRTAWITRGPAPCAAGRRRPPPPARTRLRSPASGRPGRRAAPRPRRRG